MKKITILIAMIMVAFSIKAQVAINKDGSAPDTNTILHVKSNDGGQFLFYDDDAKMTLQSYQSGNDYNGNAYIDFGNSNGGYHSVGRIGKFHNSYNMNIHSDIGLGFSFGSSYFAKHRMTESGLGLGTTLPSEMLDVVGNTKVSGNIDAGGDITANGNLWGTNGYLTDDLEIGGNFDFTGNGNIDGQVSIGEGTYGAHQLYVRSPSSVDRIAIYGENTSDSYATVYLRNNGSAEALRVNSGDVKVEFGNVILYYGNVNMGAGNVNMGTGEINRTAQGAADLIPIAYGTVDSDGTVWDAGTGNWTASWNSVSKWVEITITGESYDYQNYTTVITPLFEPRMVSTTSNNNNLVVEMWLPSGAKDTDGNPFSFVVYKH